MNTDQCKAACDPYLNDHTKHRPYATRAASISVYKEWAKYLFLRSVGYTKCLGGE
jgi:hypothetical protein